MKLSEVSGDAPKTKLSDVSAEPPSLLSQATKPLRDIPGDIAKEFGEGRKAVAEGFGNYIDMDRTKITLGALQELFSPITGAAKALVGDPLRANLPKNPVGEIIARTGELGAEMAGPGAVTKALGLAAKALPSYSDAVRKLMDEGIVLTPGQIAHRWAKGIVKTAEDSIRSLPVVGNFMASAQYKSLEGFNRAVINRSLRQIGETLPKDVAIGPDAIAHAERAIGQKYEALLPNITFKVDKQFAGDVGEVSMRNSRLLPATQQQQWKAILRDVGERLTPTGPAAGTMDGRTFQQVDSELSYIARTYGKSQNPDQKLFADAVNDLRGAMREALERSNPKYAGDLQQINSAWASFERARGASIRRIRSNGVFSPADLLADIKASSTRGVFARGDGLLQDLARAGNEVLPSTVPDSGTASRIFWPELLAGGASTGVVGLPHLPVAAGVASLPYTRAGMAGINAAARGIPSAARIATGAIEENAPAIGAGAAITDESTKK